MILGESLEDYLETLLILDNENGKIRCVDVAKKMDVSKPSVNKAMNVLKEKDLFSRKPMGIFILLRREESWLSRCISVIRLFVPFWRMYLVLHRIQQRKKPVILSM